MARHSPPPQARPANFSVEVYPLGWLICAPPYVNGIPLDALAKSMHMFPEGAQIHPGIAHHYNAVGHVGRVIHAVATPENLALWVSEIEASLVDLDREERWWRGTGVGASSAAIFGALSTTNLCHEAKHLGQGAVPRDEGDFSRCRALLDLFPEWRHRLHEVAKCYPLSQWRVLVPRWAELEASSPEVRSRILFPY